MNIPSFKSLGLFFSVCFLISGFLPFTGAKGPEHPGLERGHAWEGRETVPAAREKNQSLSSSSRAPVIPNP